jgi:hypothetical protein
MTNTVLANWPRLAILMIGDFNAVSARRSDAEGAFLASEDLALMHFSMSILVVRFRQSSLEQFLYGIQSTGADRVL